jgi:hypothetical protein
MIAPVDLSALVDLEEYLDAVPGKTRQAMSMAMNDVVGGTGLARYRKAVAAEINFPAGYINDERFGVGTFAKPDKLEISLEARQRPTSLARFAVSGSIGSQKGVSVRVNAGGGVKTFKKGFLVRLRAGTQLDADSFNVGLAVRLEPGQRLNKKDQSNMVHLGRNVVLLYGPSIDQVLRHSVIDAETPEVIDATVTEFYRQFGRLTT